MKTKLTYASVAETAAECIAIVVLDHNTDKGKDAKPQAKLASDDKAIAKAAESALASGDVTGKSLETTLIHAPAGVKTKRLLLVGGGKAVKFTADELRKVAGTAARFVKAKNLKSVAVAIPEGTGVNAADAAKAIVEGAFIGDFDPNYYASDRKDQRLTEVEVIASASGDKKALESAVEVGRAFGEAQNFTRDL